MKATITKNPTGLNKKNNRKKRQWPILGRPKQRPLKSQFGQEKDAATTATPSPTKVAPGRLNIIGPDSKSGRGPDCDLHQEHPKTLFPNPIFSKF